ncbi:MAG: hypothetical protein R3258_07670, partial [Acidimicrobiia bacterium]|nr:hypothetical protein [Acidimicrobiia bacterium]
MRRPRALYRLTGHFQILGDLGPRPETTALGFIGGLTQQLIDARIPGARSGGFDSQVLSFLAKSC